MTRMHDQRDYSSHALPNYFETAAFERLFRYLDDRHLQVRWTPSAFYVGDLRALPHALCEADPDLVVDRIVRLLEQQPLRGRSRVRLDDAPLSDERMHLEFELARFEQLAGTNPWRGHPYGSKRELYELYVLPWLNDLQDSARSILQKLELLVVARQQRGANVPVAPSLIETECLAFTSDFNQFSLWLLDKAKVGTYPYRAQAIAARLRELIDGVIADLDCEF